MNLVLLKIVAIPFKLVELDPGYSQANLRTKAYGPRNESVSERSTGRDVPANAVKLAEFRRQANVGEGRAS